MVRFCHGDLLGARVEALVNAVNCVGVMGKGLARQFKDAHPENFAGYAAACARGEVRPGRVLVVDTGRELPRYIINFPTKRHWRDRSRLEDIEAGLAALVHELRERRIASVAIPPLGCGLGGLDWADVRPMVVRALQDAPDVEALVFEPVSG